MNKQLLFFVLLFLPCTTSFAQIAINKNLFIIDSVAVINDPGEDNQMADEDIADIIHMRNKDSLKNAGFAKYDEVTYIFTKAYRNRPDSIKQIPSLNQLQMKDDGWHLNGFPYSGKYIDYYYCGKKQDEGVLINGKLNGEVKVYFKDGQLKSSKAYLNGLQNGKSVEYAKDGLLKFNNEYKDDRMVHYEYYFTNGQMESNNTLKKGIDFDTISTTYFSTGKIRQVRFANKDKMVPLPNEEKLNYLRNAYYISANSGDTKNSIKYCSKIIELDSMDVDSYYHEGEALFKEYRFDEAIAMFDKTLALEPMSAGSFGYRALARLKKYQFLNTETFTKAHKLGLLYAWVNVPIPNNDQQKICSDLQQAASLGVTELFGKGILKEAMSFYCNKK